MGSLKALTLAGGVAVATATAAHAADLPMPPPMAAPVVAPVIETSGWYLRGDVGLGTNSNPRLRTTPDPLAASSSGSWCDGVDSNGNQNCYSDMKSTYGFKNPTLSHSTFIDLGVGYQLNQWLRADATLEWRGGAHLQAVDQLNTTGTYTQNQYDSSGNLTNSTSSSYTQSLRNFYRGNVSSIVGMVNGYIDLGTFWGVTPYIGVGAGVAQNRLSGLTDQGYLYSLTGGSGSGWPTGGYSKDGKKTNFAWALMAGLSYNVSSNLKLEIGYRYMNLGKMTSGESQCFNADGTTGGSGCNWRLQASKLESHDVRIGMRWMLGAPEAPAPTAYFPAPLRSKF